MKKKKFKNVECYYDSKSAKNGCLCGALSCRSSAIVGMPIIIDASTFNDNPKKVVQNLTRSNFNNISDPTNIFSIINENWKKIKEALTNTFGNDDKEFSNANSPSSMVVNVIKELMNKGKHYRKINSNSLISISGRFYVPSDSYIINDKDQPFSIYFDGDGFYLRHKDGSHPLIASPIQGEQDLVFESQFPYSLKDGLEIPNY